MIALCADPKSHSIVGFMKPDQVQMALCFSALSRTPAARQSALGLRSWLAFDQSESCACWSSVGGGARKGVALARPGRHTARCRAGAAFRPISGASALI